MSAKSAPIRISDQAAVSLLVVVVMVGFANGEFFDGAAQIPGVAFVILACGVIGAVFGANARRRRRGQES
ncbi:hypothetical protein CDO52_25410 [Nocardiopsis gilva YIM 90087]|uniref:Uncharacterized protein n=1 Tax=Nocardiopsis gilva YIM 90087 TaxID=1235441 RepID=A0A223SC17_9ACTN|nr:hypothetical protein [Nocardiopsis gilva]ASU85697.1 hypothetical protein CDO52_25410 [Nocardiopsis gilva YIM 90087]